MAALTDLLADMLQCLALGAHSLPGFDRILGFVGNSWPRNAARAIHPLLIRLFHGTLRMHASERIADLAAYRAAFTRAWRNQRLRFFFGHRRHDSLCEDFNQ